MSSKRSRAAFESDDRPPQHAPFAIYGTPLPAYDPDARDDGSYVPVWKQEVTDEHGRKRLHGAFTGGFSAGYFNTVGSKEGWTPSTFVSSRTKRAGGGKQAQRAEDFMDEEDLAAQAESQKLETQGAFAGLGSTTSDGGTQEGMFSDLFRTTGETMGVKLLQRMGWREGQGVGPRVRRRVKGDKTGETHLFAPENSRMIGFNRKTDRKGIGFAGEERLGDSSGAKDGADEPEEDGTDARILQNSRSKVTAKPKKIKKTGIGIGVLNDTGSDDDDGYDMGPKISYNRIIGGDRKKKKGGLTANNAVQKPVVYTPSKNLTQRASTLSGFRKCHDGRLPLDGFILTMAALTITENRYPPPTVPEGWKSTKSSSAKDGESSASATIYQSTADAAKASTLDPKARAALLGEQQLPGKSVFDYLSPATRDRLATASGKTNLPPARNEAAPAGFEASERATTLWDRIPQLDKQTAAAALQRATGGWAPYSEDEGKRDRYIYFLELQAGLRFDLPPRPKTFSTDDWIKEMREFAQAAEVFKPISGLMATRFTSSTSSAPRLASDAPDPACNNKKEEDPAEKAARMGMYGPLTRSRQPFYPPRLLCKRFNVKPPANVAPNRGSHAQGDSGASSSRLDVVSQVSIDRMMQEARPFSSFTSGGTEGGEDILGQRRREAPVAGNAERNEVLEGQRASEADLRAVFGNEEEG